MSSHPPRALVFVTGRDCERSVRAALESLVWQTHPAIHVLYVDDASRDRGAEIARRLLEVEVVDEGELRQIMGLPARTREPSEDRVVVTDPPKNLEERTDRAAASPDSHAA